MPDRAHGAAAPTHVISGARDLGRALACALLVAGSIASPGVAPYLAPVVSLLIALRLLRASTDSRRVLLQLGAACLAGAALGMPSLAQAWHQLSGLVAALLLVALGWVHAAAARPDPMIAISPPAWPEPRLTTGLSIVTIAWSVGLVGVIAMVLPSIGSVAKLESDAVRRAYEVYETECARGGLLAGDDELCAQLMHQRDVLLDAVASYGAVLLAASIAVAAVVTAASVHLLVMSRARSDATVQGAIRERRRLAQLEVHWSSAYLAALGLIGWTILSGRDPTIAAARAACVGIGVLGAALLAAQGMGMIAWAFSRGGSPAWYRVLLGVLAAMFMPVTVITLIVLGAIDMAARPRRRGANSDSVLGRGSGG